MDAEFPVNARQVRFHRSLSDVQPLPYRPGAEALACQRGDLTLPISERFGTQGGGDGALPWLPEVLEVRQDIVAAPLAAALGKQIRGVAQALNCLVAVPRCEGTAEQCEATGFKLYITAAREQRDGLSRTLRSGIYSLESQRRSGRRERC